MAVAPTTSKPAVFLDRDGTINVEKNYLYKIEDWEWIPGAIETIRAFNEAGYRVVIITNQAGIARGYYSEGDLIRLNDFISKQLAKAGAKVDGYYHCPHHPEFTGNCACRKPMPGMLLNAARDLDIDLTRSWMIGDRLLDMQAAKAAGVQPILVRTGYGNAEVEKLPPGHLVFDSIINAGKYINANMRGSS